MAQNPNATSPNATTQEDEPFGSLFARWDQEAVRHAAAVRESERHLETTRAAYGAWYPLMRFTGGELGPGASDEDRHQRYVELIMNLGRVLLEQGFEKRVQGLDSGANEARRVAIEILQRAVVGDRAWVDRTYAKIRRLVFTGAGEIIGQFLDLRYGVTGVGRPIPVPPGWEGHPPETEITNTAEFTAWLERQIQMNGIWFGNRRAERTSGADVRNAFRLLAHLGVRNPHPFPLGGMTFGEEEAHLLNLRNLCVTPPSDRKAQSHGSANAPPPAPPRHHGDTSSDSVAGESRSVGRKGKNINMRMLAMLADNINHYDLSTSQFAEHLNCREGTVKATKAWKQIMSVRAIQAAERTSRTGALNGGKRKRTK